MMRSHNTGFIPIKWTIASLCLLFFIFLSSVANAAIAFRAASSNGTSKGITTVTYRGVGTSATADGATFVLQPNTVEWSGVEYCNK